MTPPPRIGVHLSTAGGVFKAAERAREIGANSFQIFSSSPRMWRAATPAPDHCAQMRTLRERFNIAPLAIHASYLINLSSHSPQIRAKSAHAFRGEVERALALGAEYLVLHPGSWKGITREEGLQHVTEAIARSMDGLDPGACGFRILIENGPGAEFSLGSTFEQVAELLARLDPVAPVGACLDTCHTHVAGYDIVTVDGYESTVAHIARTIGLDRVHIWHTNDAKAPRGSRLDRHQHIGEGTIGIAAFRRFLQDQRWRHSAFIAETPVDEPGDDARNVNVLRSLAGRPASPVARPA